MRARLPTRHPFPQIRSAIAVVRDCADSLETQAVNLGRALPVLPMPGVLRATATESVAGLREASGRVTFATSLLQAELTEKGRPVDAAVIVRSLAQMDAAMLQAVAPMADLVERLERAKSATEVLRAAVAGEVG